jgi:hypothetical protein
VRKRLVPPTKPLTLALSQRERGPTVVFGRGTPTWDIASNSVEKRLVPPANSLTLALSQRERELTGVFGRGTPTWDIEVNSGG